MALKFYRSVAKVLKLNVRKIEGSTKFLRLEKIRGKWIGAILHLPSILNNIKYLLKIISNGQNLLLGQIFRNLQFRKEYNEII